MKSKEVIDFFGGPYATGKALGISGQAVSKWPEEVPSSRAHHVELVMKLEQKKRDDKERRAAKRAEQAKEE